MANQRVAGMIQLKVDGVVQSAKGDFTYNYGRPLRAAVVGTNSVHGYTETPQVPFIEGMITDRGDVDMDALLTGKDLLITLELGNEKTFVLRGAWFAHEGTVNTQASEVPVRWEGLAGEDA